MNMISQALKYAQRGWVVFPVHGIVDGCCTCGAVDCNSPGKHPIFSGGVKNATTDTATIRDWWTSHPNANVAIATGDPSGLFVIDVDIGPGKHGEESLAALEKRIGRLPTDAVVRTGSGGLHYYFAMSNQPIRNSAGKLSPNIDVRGTGGYVVAPPSTHLSGHRYACENGSLDLPDTLPTAPSSLLAELSNATSRARPANSSLQPTAFMAEGTRNQSMASIAGVARRQGATEEDIVAILEAANGVSVAPLPSAEVHQIAHSIGKYAPANDDVPLDDIPLANIAAQKLAPSCAMTAATGWLHFDGMRWSPEGANARVNEAIKKQLQEFYRNVVASGDVERIKGAKSLLSAARVKRIADLVSSDQSIFCNLADFDVPGPFLNLQNGVLDLETMQVRAHDPALRLTKLANVTYDPDAVCPNFDRFMNDIMDEEMQAFLMRLFGYALLGQPNRQVFTIFHGIGGNGKSTLLNTVHHIFGDYARTAEPSTFIRQRSDRVRDELARLKGARLVATSELATGEILDAALVKRITGGDTITARALYKESVEFKPQFTLFMVTNALPVIDGGDKALARRLVLVPFESVIQERDDTLPERLINESSGIFNRILTGLTDYRENGLQVPGAVRSIADRYATESDLISSFFSEECVIDGSHSVPASRFYQGYVFWCQQGGYAPLSQNIFRQEITKRTDIAQKRTNKGKIWPGIDLVRRCGKPLS